MRRSRGVTLVELLIAALILGFAAPAIIGAQGASFSSTRNLQRRSLALALAQSAVEAARAKCDDGTITATASSTTDTSMPGVTFTTSTTVTNPYFDVAEIEVVCSWTEMRGGNTITDSVQLGTCQRSGAF